MFEIAVKIVNRKLTRCDNFEIPSCSTDVVLKVYANAEWENATVQFTKNGKTYDRALIDGVCNIPHEHTQTPGTIVLTIFAGALQTVMPASVTVIDSKYTDEVENEPSPGALAEAIENIKNIEKNVITYKNEAKDAADKAEAEKNATSKLENSAKNAAENAGKSEANSKKLSESSETAKNAAEAASADALTYKNAAQGYAGEASLYLAGADQAKSAAANSATSAAESEVNAKTYSETAEAAKNEAQAIRDSITANKAEIAQQVVELIDTALAGLTGNGVVS